MVAGQTVGLEAWLWVGSMRRLANRPMSALGQKQTSRLPERMSALPPIADIETRSRDVRFVPKADICHRVFSPVGLTQ